MKKKAVIMEEDGKRTEKVAKYLPFRYFFNLFLILIEIAAVIAGVIILSIYVPYFYLAMLATQLIVAVGIVASNDNPDYKIPWLFFVLLIPIIGFMLYFMFYSRKLSKKQQRKIERVKKERLIKDDGAELEELKEKSPAAYSQAVILKKLSETHLYRNTDVKYFSLGDELFPAMVQDLERAKSFIFLEYFIIEDGLVWGTILEILKKKVKDGVDVRVVYDDIGCMMTLPGNYFKQLKDLGIKCVSFGKIRGQANNEFNNRSHRKFTIIDGVIAYTGGVNLADEYINRVVRFGHWKDVGVRLEGEAVNELTRLFLVDYGLNVKKERDDFEKYYRYPSGETNGYCIPFGDGPKPIFERTVAKIAIMNLLGMAEKYVYITTPYLICDNELASALENTALRGVDIRIITPHIPDKKLVFTMTRSYYQRLMNAGVKIYEYEPGFIHAKTYLADGNTAIVGTINLDYRSLVHHFENGVWLHDLQAVADIERDFLETQKKSIQFESGMLKQSLFQRFVRSLVKIFAPLL